MQEFESGSDEADLPSAYTSRRISVFSYFISGLAALCIMGKAGTLDLDSLLHWAAGRQMGFEGGFQGRTAKLVDSCYSFWLVRSHTHLCIMVAHSVIFCIRLTGYEGGI